MSGEFRKDLTAEGFMYANNNFEKLKAEIKKTIDPLIKAIDSTWKFCSGFLRIHNIRL
jgi:hypothetical protein